MAANTPPVEYVRHASHVNKTHVQACCLRVYAIPLKGRAANTFDVSTRTVCREEAQDIDY